MYSEWTGFRWRQRSMRASPQDGAETDVGMVRPLDGLEDKWAAKVWDRDRWEWLDLGPTKGLGHAQLLVERQLRALGAPLPERFGNWLARMRSEAGLSLNRLGTLAGVDRTTLGDIEAGNHEPNLSTRTKLERYFGTSEEDLRKRITYLEERLKRLEEWAERVRA